ncbi:MAG: hypothetical protein K0R50_2613 [Eubacterium sp.]|nr:hypothetical protein [Eubacterium sp.]
MCINNILKNISMILLLPLLLFTGCSKGTLIYDSQSSYTSLADNSSYGHVKMSFDNLNGKEIRTFKAKAHKLYRFDYTCKIEKGDLRIYFTDSENRVIQDLKWISEEAAEIDSKDGEIHVNGVGGWKDVKSSDDEIKIVIESKKAEGSVELEWE